MASTVPLTTSDTTDFVVETNISLKPSELRKRSNSSVIDFLINVANASD